MAVPLLIAGSLACLGPPSRVRGPAPDAMRAGFPRVWATLTDGSRLLLEQPLVIGDTVTALSDGLPYMVPIDQVAEARVKRVSPVRTGALVVGLGTAVVLLFARSSANEPPPIDSSDFYACRLLPNPELCS